MTRIFTTTPSIGSITNVITRTRFASRAHGAWITRFQDLQAARADPPLHPRLQVPPRVRAEHGHGPRTQQGRADRATVRR